MKSSTRQNRTKEEHNDFRKIVDEWYHPIYSMLHLFIQQEEDVEEVVQDVFLKLWNSSVVWSEISNMGGYLYTIAKNLSLDYIRARKRELAQRANYQDQLLLLSTSEAMLEHNALETMIERERLNELLAAIDELPERSREIFLMSRRELLKNSEIAEKTGLSIKGVEFHITRSLAFLRKRLIQFHIFF